ncbi:tape measure protein [Acetobacter sp. DsW_063]|uniref:tape measure protein n=1 Tax=Acetobacter sp. DsW_063 TaxID=1514894 RepID=UPI000A3ADB0C|nr:tape measure protein [Acetobacter sp. DsW_063]OUJ14704.1 hypothetical protein HK28_11800 [Acetobacter sp. DsW_063]
MTSIGTLSVDLELNGDGTFVTKIIKADGSIKTLSASAKAAAASVNDLNAAMSRASGMTSMSAATQKSTDQLAALQRQADATAQAAQKAAAAINNAASAQASAATRPATATTTAPKASTATSGASSGLGASLANVASLATGFTAATLAADAFEKVIEGAKEQVAALIEAGDAYTQSVSRIQAVLGTSRNVAAETFDALERGAVQTGIDTGELVKSFTNFQIALSGVGQSREQIVDFTTTLSTLAHVSGTTSAAANRAFRELAEGMATGNVNMRQLKVVMQDMPPLGKALADSLHVTVGQLEEMAHAGKLDTETVAQAVETMGARVQKQFNDLPVSLQAARQNMSTALDQFRAELDQKLGLSQLLASFDQGIAKLAQRAADDMTSTVSTQLERAKQQLADLQAQQKNQPAFNMFASDTPEIGSTGTVLNERIAATKSLITQLQAQADADKAADAAAAATAKQQHEASEAADALSAAVKTLGFSHDDSAGLIQKLNQAIQTGHDVTIPYNDGVLRASQVLDLLRQRATPAAAAIADLNHQLVEASARAQGGFQAAMVAANLKADPADQSGQGRNLTDAQRKALQTSLDGIGAANGQDAVRNATRRLALTQARQRQDNGLSAGLLQAQYDKEDFTRQNGTGAAASAEADQLFDKESAAARIDAMNRGAKAAGAATNAVTELKARLAELNASMTGGGTETAKWAEKLKTAGAPLKAQSAQIMDLAAKLDQATAAQKRFEQAQQALAALQANVTKAQQDAASAAFELSEGPQASFQKQLDRMKRQQAELVAAARQDPTSTQTGVQASQAADQAYAAEGLALVRQQVNANREAAADILKSWDDSAAGRRKAAQDTVTYEASALQSSIDKFVTDNGERQQLTAETADFIRAKIAEVNRQTEGATAKLGRQWSDVTDEMDQATATFASDFADTLSTQLASGTASWRSFGQSVMKEIDAIAIKLAMSPLLKMLGGGSTSGDSGSGLLSLFGLGKTATSAFGAAQAGDLSDFSGVGSLVSGFHTGGIVGMGEQTFTRVVPSGLFDKATRYHTGGIAGNEIPAILQRGEGVFTRGQMAAMGSAYQSQQDIAAAYAGAANANAPAMQAQPATSSAPKITMNVSNTTGQDMKVQSGTPKFDGDAWVIDTVIKHATRPGNLRNVLKSG